MRKIEFRGKQIYNGKWVYGYLMQMYSHDRLFIGEWKNIGGEASIKDELFSSYNEVVPKTIGQFTGVKAINAVKIFEGDKVDIVSKLIMCTENGKKGIVKFIESGFYVDTGKELIPCWSDSYQLIIIGNIHNTTKL